MERFSGKVCFYNQIVDFVIEDYHLTIFAPGEIAQEIMYIDNGNGIKIIGEKKPLKVDKLTCITNDGFKNIDCFLIR